MRFYLGRAGMCVAAVALLVGCGSSAKPKVKAAKVVQAAGTSTPSTPSSTPSSGPSAPGVNEIASIATQVPAKIKAKGTLTVAADATYAPDEFIAGDGHTVIGMDPDLVTALAKVMGLKANFINETFAGIIPGLQSGKYDMGASSFTDTKARQKVVDFVTYFSSGTSFYTKAQGGVIVTSLPALCGHTVAVEEGTTEQTDATGQKAKCTAAHKTPDTVLVYPTQNEVNLSVTSDKAQLAMADSQVAHYAMKQAGGLLQVTGQPYGTAPYGLAFPKGTGMTKPTLAALKALMSDGEYMKILDEWGIQAGAISNPTINGATS